MELRPDYWFRYNASHNDTLYGALNGVRKRIATYINAASPMDVEAQVPGTSGGNRWLVETMYFVLRILELVSILALRFTSYYPFVL